MPKKNQSARRREKKEEEKKVAGNNITFDVTAYIDEEKTPDSRFVSEPLPSWITDIKWASCFGLKFRQKYTALKLSGLLKESIIVDMIYPFFNPTNFKVFLYPVVEQRLRELAEYRPELGEFLRDWMREFKAYIGPSEIGLVESTPLLDYEWIPSVRWMPRGSASDGGRRWTLFDLDRLFTGDNFPADKLMKLCLAVKMLSMIPRERSIISVLFQPSYITLESWYFMRILVNDGYFAHHPSHDEFFKDYVRELLDEIRHLETDGLHKAKSLLDVPEVKAILDTPEPFCLRTFIRNFDSWRNPPPPTPTLLLDEDKNGIDDELKGNSSSPPTPTLLLDEDDYGIDDELKQILDENASSKRTSSLSAAYQQQEDTGPVLSFLRPEPLEAGPAAGVLEGDASGVLAGGVGKLDDDLLSRMFGCNLFE